jgi:predicted phage tail protein
MNQPIYNTSSRRTRTAVQVQTSPISVQTRDSSGNEAPITSIRSSVASASTSSSSLNLLKISNESMASELSTIMDDYRVSLQRAEKAELLLADEQQKSAKLGRMNAELSGENDEMVEEVQEMVEELQDLYEQIHTMTEEKQKLERLSDEIAMERDELTDKLLEESRTHDAALCPEEIAQETERVRQTERAMVHAVLAENLNLVQHLEQLTKQNNDMQAELDFIKKRYHQKGEGISSSMRFAQELKSRNPPASVSGDSEPVLASKSCRSIGSSHSHHYRNRGSITEENMIERGLSRPSSFSSISDGYRRHTMDFISSAVSSTVSMAMPTSKFKTKPTRTAAGEVSPQPQGQPQQPHPHPQRGSLTFVDQAMGYFTFSGAENLTEPPQQQRRSGTTANETEDGMLVGNQGDEHENFNGTKGTDDELLCPFGRFSFDDDRED